MATENTDVEKVSEQEINDILALPGPSNIVTGEDKPKNTIFTDETKAVDKSLEIASKEEIAKTKAAEIEAAKIKAEKDLADKNKAAGDKKEGLDEKGKDILDEHHKNSLDEEIEEEGLDKNKGRPKEDKSLLIDVMTDLIKQGALLPFDDEKKIEDYTKQDALDLFKANLTEKEENLKEQVNTEFFESLSPQLKYLAKFEYDGGKNLVPVLKALLNLEEARVLDPENEKDQETIVRKWYSLTEFGSDEEIEKEIASLKDRAELDKKAKQFKPKLDSKEDERIKKDVLRQEEIKKAQQEATQNYIKNIATVLQPGELNGLKIDKKIQNKLFVGLTSPQYPAMNGSTTNLLGHLLEKHQVHEPNHALVAEALWLLSDPDEYRAKVRETAAKEQSEETFRKLKSAEKDKDSGANNSSANDDDSKINKKKSGTVRRPNILARP